MKTVILNDRWLVRYETTAPVYCKYCRKAITRQSADGLWQDDAIMLSTHCSSPQAKRVGRVFAHQPEEPREPYAADYGE